ncbi:FAD-binding domain-containing protein [Thozetella sp. PMI_491]|nr:FAD-binding domain-containing protein [Thozetella sp. PMI_491]
MLLHAAWGFNFPYERVELTEADVGNFHDISFASISTSAAPQDAISQCRAFPGTADWPTDGEWARLNSTLGGALLKPTPVASVCYPGPDFDQNACNFLLSSARNTRFFSDDPLTVLVQWTEGNTCLVTANPQGNCTQGGFPVYVLNATSVKQIQTAVNFARNKNVRLIIKNTGHDFGGRSVGAGSLSIWTHYLKDFEFLPDYIQPGGGYRGMAARVGAGLETFNQFNHMAEYNISLVVPSSGCPTVGPYGGWAVGGGHSQLTSLHGLGADQFLSLQVVTADGRFVTADPTTNIDLFFALRGGGASTYGIVTSAIVKAYPQIDLPVLSFSFSLSTATPAPPNSVSDIEEFWDGVSQVYRFATTMVDSAGFLTTSLSGGANSSAQIIITLQLPGKTVSDASAFTAPLFTALNDLGIPIEAPVPVSHPYGTPLAGIGDFPTNIRLASRLFPRVNWDNDDIFNQTMATVRNLVTGGYTFRGLNMAATLEAAGNPPPSGLNPVWRTAIMHADIFDFASLTAPAADMNAAHDRLNQYMAPLRAVTAAGGAYINEADVQEPNWQQSFFGESYPKLLKVKKARDPWGLFWAPTTVGSEKWAVVTADGLPTQNGPLCKTGISP